MSLDTELKKYGKDTELIIDYVLFIEREDYFDHILDVNNLERDGIFNIIQRLKSKRLGVITLNVYYIDKRFEKSMKRIFSFSELEDNAYTHTKIPDINGINVRYDLQQYIGDH